MTLFIEEAKREQARREAEARAHNTAEMLTRIAKQGGIERHGRPRWWRRLLKNRGKRP